MSKQIQGKSLIRLLRVTIVSIIHSSTTGQGVFLILVKLVVYEVNFATNFVNLKSEILIKIKTPSNVSVKCTKRVPVKTSLTCLQCLWFENQQRDHIEIPKTICNLRSRGNKKQK